MACFFVLQATQLCLVWSFGLPSSSCPFHTHSCVWPTASAWHQAYRHTRPFGGHCCVCTTVCRILEALSQNYVITIGLTLALSYHLVWVKPCYINISSSSCKLAINSVVILITGGTSTQSATAGKHFRWGFLLMLCILYILCRWGYIFMCACVDNNTVHVHVRIRVLSTMLHWMLYVRM